MADLSGLVDTVESGLVDTVSTSPINVYINACYSVMQLFRSNVFHAFKMDAINLAIIEKASM
jgi:hypothetical protein